MIREFVSDFLADKLNVRTIPMPIAKTSFCASYLKKDWVNEVSYIDCVQALKQCEVIPSIIIGEKEYFASSHHLAFNFTEKYSSCEKKILECNIATKQGTMHFEETLIARQMGALTYNILDNDNGLSKLIAYLNDVMENVSDIVSNVVNIRKQVGNDCIIQFFIPQPFEVYCLVNREQAIYLKYDEDKTFFIVKDKIMETITTIMKAVAASGAVDFFLFGSAGTELYSPSLFDEEFLQPSKQIIRLASELNVPTIYHACGNMKALFEKSRILELEPTVFEGLAFEGIGDLQEKHFNMIDNKIVIRGNIDLSLLQNGSVDEIKRKIEYLVNTFKGKRFITSGCCDLLYGTKAENIKALNYCK